MKKHLFMIISILLDTVVNAANKIANANNNKTNLNK
jgi:hypothetical protein